MKTISTFLLTIFLLGFSANLFSQVPAHNVTLTWAWSQGTGGAATGFQIQRGTVHNGPYTTIGAVSSPTILTYVDTSATSNVLQEGVTYYYVVEAVGPGGTSLPSNETSATIPFAVPVAPTGAAAVAH